METGSKGVGGGRDTAPDREEDLQRRGVPPVGKPWRSRLIRAARARGWRVLSDGQRLVLVHPASGATIRVGMAPEARP